MVLTIRQVRHLAQQWVDQFDNLPTGRRTLARNYEADKARRRFTVMFNVARLRKDFCLIEFYVHDDGAIELQKDRRARVQELLEKEGISFRDFVPVVNDYAIALGRFLVLCAAQDKNVPSWFHGIKQVEEPTSEGKADAYAIIDLLDGERQAEVRIKITTSQWGKTRYYKKLKTRQVQRVVALVIVPNKSDFEIREELYHYLNEIRKKRVYG